MSLIRKKFFIVLIFFQVAVALRSADWDWQTQTSTLNIRDMCGSYGKIWCATEGGLLVYNPINNQFTARTNTEGLALTNVTAVVPDVQECIWIGFDNGIIQRYDSKANTWWTIKDYEDHQITSLYYQGDTLFVGLDIGVSIYLIEREEVKETYRRLGPQLQVEIPVRDIYIQGNTIWIGTDEGVAYASLDNPNLLNPSSWNNITAANGLPDVHVTSILEYEGHIIVSTDGGVVQQNENTWDLIYYSPVVNMTVHENKLLIITPDKVYSETGDQWVQMGEALKKLNILLSFDSGLWAGSNEGIYHYLENNAHWEHFTPNCLESNLISAVSFDRNNNLWCCSRDNGVFKLRGRDSIWETINRNVFPELKNNDFVSVFSYSDHVLLGSWGGGMVSIVQDSIFKFYRAENSPLVGISNDPSYAVVNGITIDLTGTLWFFNYAALTNQPLYALTKDSVWTTYGSSDGLSSIELRSIAVDHENRKWVGTDDQGVYIIDDNGTPSVKSDDPPIDRITTSSILASNYISALAVDGEGAVWIGTQEGLYYYLYGYIERRYGALSDYITSLAVDGENNLWIGTNTGVSLFLNEQYTWQHFTQENSALLSNDVFSIGINYQNGTVAIGTGQGLSILYTPYSQPEETLENLDIFPNPFIFNQHESITIKNLSADVSISIFNMNGYLVREMGNDMVHGNMHVWDVKDDHNMPVSSGVYLIVVNSIDGESKIGKVAIIR